MKKIMNWLLFCITCLFLFSSSNVKAWKGSYNYEVTKFEVDDNYAYVSGWAILNSINNYNVDGMGRNFVAPGGRGNEYDRQSGVIVYDGKVGKRHRSIYEGLKRYGANNTPIYGAYCKYGSTAYYDSTGNKYGGSKDSDYLYDYSLSISGVKNGKVVKGTTIASSAIEKVSPPKISLTYSQAYKVGYVAYAQILSTGSFPYTTACYEDVGFKFKIDLSKLVKKNDIDGYKMTLTVRTGKKSTCKKNCSETFDLNVIYVKDNTDSTSNFNIKYLNNYNTKVENLMRNGYTWKDPGFANYKTKSSSYAIQIGNRFDVIGSKIVDGVRWYQIMVNRAKRWIPASWVKPVNNTTIIAPDGKKEVDICTSNLVDKPKNEKCSNCAGVKSIDFSEGKMCISPVLKTEFYNISCNEKVEADFKPGNLTLKIGEGFYYGVDVYSIKKCVGNFNGSKWKESYNNALSIRDSYKKGSAGYNEANNLLKELVGMVDSYISWNYQDNNEPYGTIEINYKQSGKKKNLNYSFESVLVNKGEGSFVKKETVDLKISGVKNPTNFIYSNENNKRLVRLIPPITYLDRVTGNVTDDKTMVNGGNKFYIDYNGDIGIQDLKIVITNLGSNHNSSITNEKCNLNVYKNNLIYRLIDVGNPFINNKREIGQNWLNDNYNFTDTIRNDIWNLKYLYYFDLPHNDIVEIKKSNSNNKVADSYLGTCHLKANMQDEITKKICGLLNQK